MNSELSHTHNREEQELARKREELALLQTRLADREFYLSNVRAELVGFEGRYLREVGVLYAELDDWKAKIAEFAADVSGTADAQVAAGEARARAEESYAAAHSEAANAVDHPSSPEVDRLFREVAREIHPDLTDDEDDRALRTRLMAEANLARGRGDLEALKKILEEYKSSPESVKGAGMTADLLRILRRIKRVERRLAQIEAEVAELTSSEIAMLMSKVQAATLRNRDLLREMADDVRGRIGLAQREYEEMFSKVNANEC